jgi:hypothetical protein
MIPSAMTKARQMNSVKGVTSSRTLLEQDPPSARASPWLSVTEHKEISEAEFASSYRDACHMVLLRGRCAAWSACRRWSPSYFYDIAANINVPVKTYGDTGKIHVASWSLRDYARFILERSYRDHKPEPEAGAIPYCHDIPLLGLVESLAEDCRPFPAGFLSPWYRRHWWRYSQFFMGPAGTVTPLHFDTLLTHNLFFQIYGTKQFTVLPHDQARYCGRRGWRWFDVDPERPDYTRFPEYRQATPTVVLVKAGDVFYMPPGTLHHVRSLEPSISFNIDFHTRLSVLKALARCGRGMPAKSAYYNAVVALSVVGKIPEAVTFPSYRPYLSYVS